MPSEFSKEYYEKYNPISSYNPIRVCLRYREYINAHQRILLLPCGDGNFITNMSKRGWDIYGGDINKYALDQCKSRETRIKRLSFMDIRHINKPNRYYDVTLCRYLLEHLDFREIDKALAELHRVTRWYVYLGVTTSDVKPRNLAADLTHKTFLTWAEWCKFVKSYEPLGMFKVLEQRKQKEEWLLKVLR